MMKNINITGRLNGDELRKAIEVVYHYAYDDFFKKCDIGVTHWGQGSDGTLYLSYRQSDTCRNIFPVVFDCDMVCMLVDKYLSHRDKDDREAFGGDGITIKGFSLEYNEFNVEYDFKIKFETLYYGK